MIKKFLAVLFSLVAGSVQAATLIDFEDLAIGTSETFTSQGFDFVSSQPLTFPAFIAGSSEDHHLQVDYNSFGGGSNAGVSMTAAGQVFSLDSFDLVGTLALIGERADGSLVSGGGSGFDSIILDSQWDDLISVKFIVGAGFPPTFSVDNISVNIVPLPAALWLFGTALGLLGWVRKN